MSVSEGFATEFRKHWSNDTVTSLRQVQALYGAIAEADVSTAASVVPEAFQLYVTPGELAAFTTDQDDDNRLVTVQVDLTGDDPELVGVDVRPLRPDAVPKLGFSRFPWGRGIDHSITRRGAKGGSTRDTVVSYCEDCLVRWTDADGREPAVGRIAEEHPDGWVIRALQRLGLRDDIEDGIEAELRRLLGADESPRVVATVAVTVDPGDLEREPAGDPEDGFYYPGQLHVMNAAMRARKEQKLAEKNSDVPSRGDGTCLVTGEDEEVFGTAEDPLALFTVQHAEKFAGLKREHAWRSHPISSRAAILVQSGASLVEECRDTRHGRSVYTIPYFVRMDAERASLLHSAVGAVPGDAESQMAKLQENFEEVGETEFLADLRYYVVALRNDSGDINVLHEVPDATFVPVRELAEAHVEVTDAKSGKSSTFHAVAGFDHPENWRPYTANTGADEVARTVTSGFYARGTLAPPEEDDPSTDDTAEWLTFSLLTGEPVPAERLLAEYVERLAREREDDEESRLSANHLKAQFAQLEALARADRLVAPNHPELTDPPRMTDDVDVPPAEQFLDDGQLRLAAVQEYRLQRFIDERPSLDDDSRRGSFLAGVLVGQLGEYQSRERDMNQTVLDQYPAEQMTGDRIERLVPELVGKTNVYASDDQYSGPSLFPELDDRLPGALQDARADDWSIPVADLRFHFALGQLYGKRSRGRAFELRELVARDAGIDLDDTDSTDDDTTDQ